MGTEIFYFGLREAEIIEFKEGWGPNAMSGPRESCKVGWVTLKPIYPVNFCGNYKV